MADNKQHDTPATTRRPDCVTEIRMGKVRPCRVRLFQERHHNHSRRQNGAGTGSGSRCYTGARLIRRENRGMEKRPGQGA